MLYCYPPGWALIHYVSKHTFNLSMTPGKMGLLCVKPTELDGVVAG
jgi:hypothetical protein